MNKTIKHTLATAFTAGALLSSANAAIIYTDDFSTNTTATGTNVWSSNTGTPTTYNGGTQDVTYAHTAGTTRRFVNPTTVGTSGYMRVTISGFTGSPDGVWVGFAEDNAANNANYAQADVVGNGIYELFVNNTASSIAFDNGGGWTGTLAANSGLVSTNNGSTTTALDFGGQVDSGVTFKGFGFANFGNATQFPTAAFTIDDVIVESLNAGTGDLTILSPAVVPEPSSTALLGLGALALIMRKRR